MDGDKTVRVGGFEYAIDESTGTDIATIAGSIRTALTERSVAAVPVLDEKRNRMTLYLNGATADAVVVDLGEGPPRPGEMSP